MSTSEELKALLASFERLAIHTKDEARREKLREIILNLRLLLVEPEKSDNVRVTND